MKKILFKSLTFLIAIMGIFLYTQVFANGSDIDPSFDTKTPVGFNGTIYAHVVQSDGKIIVGGDFTTYQGIPAQYLIRLNSDGTKDASFTAYTGISTVKTMAIQSDGKLLVGGWISYSGIGATGKRIYRLNTNGSLDSSFTSSNTIRLANNILIESDGKILVAGSYGANYNSRVDKVFRLNTDGSTNNSSLFSASNSRSIQTIVLQYDGKILLEQEDPFGGSNTYATIVRLNTGGSVDTSFVSYGFNTPGRVKSLAMQSDGKILVGGDFYTYSGVDARSLMRLNTNGTRDFTFTSYIFNVAGPYTVAIQNDGKILVGGRFTTYSGVSANSIVRLNSDGTRDSSFVIGNGFDSNTNSITSQSDGKILIDGVFTTYNGSSAKGFIRLNTDGTKDTSLSMGDGFDASVKAIVVQNDGQVLIGGSFVSYSGVAANGVVRLDSNGNRDSTFNVQSGHMIIVNDIAIQNDGKILIGGNTNSTDRPGLIRLNADGSIDTSFSVSGENTGLFKFPLCVSKVVVQSNNKIITTSCNADEMYSEIPNNVLRLNTDGSIDHSFAGYRFSQNGGAGTVWIYALAVQNDGKILIGGQFNTYGGVGANGIIRLNTNGTIDTGFLMGSGFAYASYQEPMDFGGEGTREYNTTISNVKDIVIQDDGKILIGGNFTAYNLITGVNYIVRLTTNGVTDTTFVTAEGFNNPVYDISLQSGNKILAAGQFTSYDNQSSKNIALLNTDGTRNPAINSYGIDARVLTRRNDGEVLVGGGFSIYNGSAVGYLVSLYGESDLVILPDSTNTGTVVAEFTDKGYTQVNQDLVGSKSISLILTTGNIPLELNLVNQDIKLTIPADTQFLEGTSQTYYSGIISVAIPKTMTSISSLPVLSAFKVGSSSTPLDLSGGEATLLVPTPTENIGNLVQIYYSEDNGVTWYSQGLTTVGDNNGYPYVTFTTDHFTDFAVAAISGSFLINNGATATNTNAVTLNIRTTPAAKMRFSNDNSTRSNWETYGTITGRTLLAGVGEKTVYAEFDVDNDNVADISTSDIILYDATAPTGTIAYLPASGTMTNGDVVATITLNETGTVTSIGGNIHTFTGNGSFTFTFQDEAGNTGNATASVNRIDKEGPTVTLNGSSTITLSYGNSYTEAGATRTDTYDGIGNATISGLVNTGIIGTYILEYSHIDTAGNTGNTVTRTIHVVDTIAPIVTLNGDVTVTVEYGNEYSESGATRTDNYDGTGDATISGTINTGALGTYLVDYFYIDTAGNTGNIVTRTIHIVDTTAPIVILNGDVTVTVEYGNEYSESGATRSDIYDGTGDATISGGVNTGIIGTYILEYSHIDTAGNTGNTVTRTIHVVDTIAPIITLNGDSTITVQSGSTYIEQGATRTDNYDGTGDATISGSVDTSTAGTYLLEYSYIDHAGNTGNSVLRTIIVTSFSCNDVTDISTPECEALVALYNSTDGRNRYNSGGWLQPGTVCGTRYGITCSGTQVTEINIQGNNLSGTITSLSGLSYLTYLGLSSNRITSIESGAFNGLSSLIQLALDADQLTSLSNGMFNGLSSLQGLSISSNQITSIESGAFNGVPNLITLSLAGNQISSLGNKVFNSLSSLNSLGLGNNQLTSIKSGTFDGLSSLTTLDLAYNQITFIESGSFSNLSTLLSLGLLVNQLTSLPSGIFDGLSNLTTLSLSVNQLASLGTGSFNGLSSLLFLYLDGNHLTSIASGIFDGLHNLQTLGLENNQIVSVTSGVFSGLSSLVTLGIAPSCSTTFIDLGTGFVCTDTSYTDESTCLAASYCVDQQYTDQISCESHYSCGDQQYTGEAACLAAGYCSDGQYTGQTDCENGGATRNIYGYARSQNTRNNYGNAWISNGVTSQMDTNSCGLISTDDPTELINELNNKGYSNGGGLLGFDENYHIGSFGLSFYDGLTNTISTNIILQYTNQSGYPGEYFNSIAEIQTTNGTNITQNEQPFTGVFHGPVLFTTGNVPELTGVVALMRFGALIHRIDFSQPVIIRMPVLEASVGDTVSIYSSDEESIYGASGAHWQFEKTGTVIDINGIPYVEFTTTHASRYALNNVVHSENNGNNENNGTTDTSHGSPTLTKDVCPTQRDCSSSYYDHLCGPCPTTMTGTKNIHGSATPYCPAYSSELNQAYGFAFDNGITTINSCTTVNLTGTLIRSHMAKMISEFAIRVLKIKPDTTKSCTFTDMKTQSKEMQFYATLACQLGLMGYASDGVTMNINFNPEQEVDRAQFGTILSRLLRGTKYAGGNPYYSKHLTALKADGIMTKIDNPKQKEMRGRVMLMMQRIFEKGKK